jgi:hypothetical protein
MPLAGDLWKRSTHAERAESFYDHLIAAGLFDSFCQLLVQPLDLFVL